MDGKSLTLAAWILTAACTGGRGDGPETGTSGTVPMTFVGTVGSDEHGHAVELFVECARFGEVVAEGG